MKAEELDSRVKGKGNRQGQGKARRGTRTGGGKKGSQMGETEGTLRGKCLRKGMPKLTYARGGAREERMGERRG